MAVACAAVRTFFFLSLWNHLERGGGDGASEVTRLYFAQLWRAGVANLVVDDKGQSDRVGSGIMDKEVDAGLKTMCVGLWNIFSVRAHCFVSFCIFFVFTALAVAGRRTSWRGVEVGKAGKWFGLQSRWWPLNLGHRCQSTRDGIARVSICL